LSISIYDQSIVPLSRALHNLAAIVTKAEAHIEAEGIAPDAIDRISRTILYLDEFKPEQFEGTEKKDIHLELGPHSVDFTGKDYLVSFVMPNFYFHVSTAYAILRHNGVKIGKADFLGATQ